MFTLLYIIPVILKFNSVPRNGITDRLRTAKDGYYLLKVL
jgi:hypothetical protein